MNPFQSIIAKLKAGFEAESNKHRLLAEAITEVLGVAVREQDISIRKGILHLSIPPTLKIAVKMKHEALLGRCKAIDTSIYSIS